nr:MAG TPA: hypothetical protein [Caudoviricetes sp.]
MPFLRPKTLQETDVPGHGKCGKNLDFSVKNGTA